MSKIDAYTSERDLAMLHHFVLFTSHDLFDRRAIYGSQDIDIMSLATSHGHIMHAIIAAAALHLRETTPAGGCYTELEAKHWLSASSKFRTVLRVYGLVTNPDPLLTTCMLLNMLAFANVGSAETAFSTNRSPFTPTTPDSLQWISVRLGLSTLLLGLSRRIKGDSIWLPLSPASGTKEVYDDRPGVEDIPPSYIIMSDTTPSSVSEAPEDPNGIASGHPYLRLVRRVITPRRLYNEATGQMDHSLNR